MLKKKKDTSTSYQLKRHLSFVYVLLMIGLVLYLFGSEFYRRWEIRSSRKMYITAVVTSEKAYVGNSPVSGSFTYKYKFDVGGKHYSGITHDENLGPGDSIEIEYVIRNPSINAPKDYYNTKTD